VKRSREIALQATKAGDIAGSVNQALEGSQDLSANYPQAHIALTQRGSLSLLTIASGACLGKVPTGM
jgi:hypothetical protein